MLKHTRGLTQLTPFTRFGGREQARVITRCQILAKRGVAGEGGEAMGRRHPPPLLPLLRCSHFRMSE
eukprot:scaffold121648_cov41-Tisochrysis_lutea.AAC.1